MVVVVFYFTIMSRAGNSRLSCSHNQGRQPISAYQSSYSQKSDAQYSIFSSRCGCLNSRCHRRRLLPPTCLAHHPTIIGRRCVGFLASLPLRLCLRWRPGLGLLDFPCLSLLCRLGLLGLLHRQGVRSLLAVALVALLLGLLLAGCYCLAGSIGSGLVVVVAPRASSIALIVALPLSLYWASDDTSCKSVTCVSEPD
ncbi:hypothetical protein B0T17DRAFT_153632 [Bombardia bombarda]|uniref:Uncharacterized protein n=1 Tax=Bombardia bombarda TaxID=252184 RepID=A0AA39X7P5_9PEZI|nr:hypothetical protein B0T17DRAFT_153632 [Bombardia bombarda]